MINTNLPPSCTVSKLWLIFASGRGVPHFNALARSDHLQYRHKWYTAKTTFFGLHFRHRKYLQSICNHLYIILPESYRIWWNYGAVRAITPFKVIQGHQFWYQSKGHIRLRYSRYSRQSKLWPPQWKSDKYSPALPLCDSTAVSKLSWCIGLPGNRPTSL